MKPPTTFRITPANLDSALRYERAIALIVGIYRPDLSILEIGSGSAGITEFLKHRVTGVDAKFERTAERHSNLLHRASGTATDLPFPAASYDVVVSIDMLEHIPAADRTHCLAEMLRILRPGGRCIVAFPADASGERMDRRLNDAYRKRNHVDHPWIAEHIEHGLPRTEEVVTSVRAIAGPSVRVKVHKHLWGPAWWHAVHRFPTLGGAGNLPLIWRISTPQGARFVSIW